MRKPIYPNACSKAKKTNSVYEISLKKNEEPRNQANTDVQNLRRSLNELQLNGTNNPGGED